MQDFTNCLMGGNASSGNSVANLTCIPIILSDVVFWLFGLVAVTAVILVIYGGAKFVLSAGDPKQVDSARKTITYALIGMVLVLFAFGIVKLIGYVTGVKCISQFSIGGCQ